MNTFDFEYEAPNGKNVIVEVDFYYEEPDPFSKYSDWDYEGGLIVDGLRIYSGIEEVFDVNVTMAEIAFQFKRYIEDMEMQYAMETNESF